MKRHVTLIIAGFCVLLFTGNAQQVTIFENSGRTIMRNAFSWGDVVYARITSALSTRCYRLEWIRPGGSVVELTQDSPAGGGTTRDLDFTVPAIGPSGVWSLKMYESSSGTCSGFTLKTTLAFEVARVAIVGPVADSHVDINAPTTNYGSVNNLHVKADDGKHRRVFVRFDLAGLGITGTVSSATLRLWLYDAPKSTGRTYNARRVLASWAEAGINWSNQPAVAASVTSTTSTGTTDNVFRYWDVAGDVQSFVGGINTNYGWRISDNLENDDKKESKFSSKEKNAPLDKTEWPVLLIDYLLSCTAPVLTCPSPIASGTDPGECGATIAFGASATGLPAPDLEYKIGSTVIESPYTFPIGVTTVDVTATNSCGTQSCSFTVTVTDDEDPMVVTQDVIVELDASGNASVTTGDIDNGSTDNCGIALLSLDVSSFTCDDVGDNVVTLTVTDVNGNSASAPATVTVIAPDIDIPVSSNAYGAVEVGSWSDFSFAIDNPGTADLVISSISISGPNAAEFSVETAPISPIPPSGSSTLVIRFTPATAPVAMKSATISIGNNDPCGGEDPSTIAVNGYGIPPLPHPYLLLASEKVYKIDGQLGFDGNIHSNKDVEMKKGNPSMLTGNITACDKIKIDKDNTIVGDVQGAVLNIHPTTVITGSQTIGAAAAFPIPPVLFAAGGPNVTVPKNGSSAIAPGSFGNVKLEENGILGLSTGTYFLNKLELKKKARLAIDITAGPVLINVVDKCEFDKESKIDIIPLGDAGSRWVTIQCMDKDVKIDSDARLLGSINAPNAKVDMKKNVSFKGAICGKKIDIDHNGTILHHTSAMVLPKIVNSIDERPSTGSFELLQNYPNPFNPSTTISFRLGDVAHARLSILNSLGREIAVLVDDQLHAGSHTIRWDTEHEAAVSSGMYTYRLHLRWQNGEESQEFRQMVLLK